MNSDGEKDLDFKDRFFDPFPALPNFLIYNIEDDILDFHRSVSKYDVLGYNVPDVVADLINLISDQEDAEYELAYDRNEILNGIPKELNDEINDFLNARNKLAKRLIFEFINSNVYINKKLYYQFNSLLQNALVMEKICAPKTNSQRHKDRIRRAANLISRRMF